MTPAPFFEDIAFGPKGGAAHWLTTSDGLRIRVGHWPVAEAKGTVLILPGRTEYIEKYGDAAARFADAGYASVAIDWRGQGLADRLLNNRALGHVGDFADYQTDIAAMMAHVAELDLPKPYFLVGHSMGGCIGLRALHEQLDVKAAAFSAPMWGLHMSPAALRPTAWAMSWIARKIGLGTRIVPLQTTETYVLREDFDANTLTRDPEMWDRLKVQMTAQPELALGGPTLHWLHLALRETRRLAQMSPPPTPTVTFVGTAETIVDAGRIRDVMGRWDNGTLHVIDKGEHEVMLEIPASRQFVLDTMIAHFDAQL